MDYKLIEYPNLPKNKVKHCFIGEKYFEEIKELEELGLRCIILSENTDLDSEISRHADINCLNCGTGKILLSCHLKGDRAPVVDGICFDKSYELIKSPYPGDVRFNVSFIKNKLICNKKHISSNITDLAERNNIQIIDVKQGYARCSICIVNENAIITDDSKIACLLKKYQIDVLEISKGAIRLSEKHYGFIGGASGKISENEIYFSGNLSMHPDYKSIIDFLSLHNVQALFNKNRPLRDFGGFIPLTETL